MKTRMKRTLSLLLALVLTLGLMTTSVLSASAADDKKVPSKVVYTYTDSDNKKISDTYLCTYNPDNKSLTVGEQFSFVAFYQPGTANDTNAVLLTGMPEAYLAVNDAVRNGKVTKVFLKNSNIQTTYNITRSDDGLVSKITSTTRKLGSAYDLNRQVETTHFEYDLDGNITSITKESSLLTSDQALSVVSYTFGYFANRMVSVTTTTTVGSSAESVSALLRTDNSGRVTKTLTLDSAKTYDYDTAGRPTKLMGLTVSYYDTNYVASAAETDDNGAVKTQYQFSYVDV